MNIRTDIVKMYKEIHGWVGIVSGLCLFVAFFAGALTMFEIPIQRWASPPSTLAAPVTLDRTPELVAKVLAAHPEAAKGYTVHLATGADEPARVTWEIGGRGANEHAEHKTFYAALAPDGSLQVEEDAPSPVGNFIDVLHQQVGIMIDHELAMPIMGSVALLYAIALVSCTIVLLPSLVKDLFALRLGKNVKRMWLDLHNVLGLFSLPFHIVMALTSVVFAFHDGFYLAQNASFVHQPERPAAMTKGPRPGGGRNTGGHRAHHVGPAASTGSAAIASPQQVVQHLAREVPGFTPLTLAYGQGRDGKPSLRVQGSDPRYGLRGPTFTLAILDPATGAVTGADYLGGRQDGWGATITAFFALHFGSFGGSPVRWAYFLLGLSGAAIFYTGNLLWVESRRRRERKAGAVEQTRATRVLGALTVGVPLGCIAGVAVTLAAAKPLGTAATPGVHSAIYHAVFFSFVGWALLRGSARGAIELLPGAALALLAIPAMSLACAGFHPERVWAVDGVALILAVLLGWAWKATLHRARSGPRDSVWSALPAGQSGGEAPRPAL